MPIKLMLDSGAFSVWSSGKKIDLDEYTKFCKEHSNFTTVVNLDVIPPKGLRLSKELKEACCQEGWDNYMSMLRHIPLEQLVPVFHRGEDFKWLEKYLDFGSPYIGLSPRFDGTSWRRRQAFLQECKKYILRS